MQGRARYLPFLLRVCFLGRSSLLLAVLAVFLWGASAPSFALAALIAAYAALWLADGAGYVPWTALVGKTVARQRRGAFFATTQIVGGLGRIAAARFIIGPLLAGAVVAFPGNAALLILICALLMAASLAFLFLVREPPPQQFGDEQPAAERLPLAAYLRTLPAAFRARPDVARLALAQVLGSGLGAGMLFYFSFARSVFPDLPLAIAGRFLVIQTLGELLFAPVWGTLTDRRGPRAALVLLFVTGVLSPVGLALGALTPVGLAGFYIAYFCLGAVLEGGWSIYANYLLEAVPAPEQPTYIGLMNVVNAPGLLLPLIAGLLVAEFGLPAAPLLAGLFLSAGLFVVLGLPDRRRTAAIG